MLLVCRSGPGEPLLRAGPPSPDHGRRGWSGDLFQNRGLLFVLAPAGDHALFVPSAEARVRAVHPLDVAGGRVVERPAAGARAAAGRGADAQHGDAVDGVGDEPRALRESGGAGPVVEQDLREGHSAVRGRAVELRVPQSEEAAADGQLHLGGEHGLRLLRSEGRLLPAAEPAGVRPHGHRAGGSGGVRGVSEDALRGEPRAPQPEQQPAGDGGAAPAVRGDGERVEREHDDAADGGRVAGAHGDREPRALAALRKGRAAARADFALQSAGRGRVPRSAGDDDRSALPSAQRDRLQLESDRELHRSGLAAAAVEGRPGSGLRAGRFLVQPAGGQRHAAAADVHGAVLASREDAPHGLRRQSDHGGDVQLPLQGDSGGRQLALLPLHRLLLAAGRRALLRGVPREPGCLPAHLALAARLRPDEARRAADSGRTGQRRLRRAAHAAAGRKPRDRQPVRAEDSAEHRGEAVGAEPLEAGGRVYAD